MATLDETRRLNDWTLEQVMKRFKLGSADAQVNRSEMEASICSASTSKMTGFVVRSTINVLLALNVLTEHASQGTLTLNPDQAKCIENIDHYSHALHLLRQEKQRLREEERSMICELLSLHTGASTQQKKQRQAVEMPVSTTTASSSASEKRLQKDQAIARVRNLQIQLHARRGLLESTLAAHPAKPAQVPIQLGPLGMQDPSSKGTSSSSNTSSSSKRHCGSDAALKPGFEVELKSTSVDFISFIGSQFEPWTGQHHDHDTIVRANSSTMMPRVHTPKSTGSPSPQSASTQQQHCWPAPSPPPTAASTATPASALKLPQWKLLVNKPTHNNEEPLTVEEMQEELDLENDALLLERHDKVLKGIRSQFELAEEERKLRQRESGGLKSTKSTASRTPSTHLSRSTSSGSGRRH